MGKYVDEFLVTTEGLDSNNKRSALHIEKNEANLFI